jgi:hypothetical protein
VSRHEPSVDRHNFDEIVQALNIQLFHRGTVTDLAFLQLLQHIRERAAFEIIVHRPKLLLSQFDRIFFVTPTFS